MSHEEGDPWNVTETQLRDALRSQDCAGAVATVTAVDGSAYRRPGAKMLVTESGVHRGAVTAGCLEPSVVDICADVVDSGTARTVRFDLTDEDGWGLGLGCNGVIDLLVEPHDASWSRPLDTLSEREPVTLVTVVEPGPDTAVGDRLVIDSEGTHPVPDREPIPAELVTQVSDVVDAVSGTDSTRTVDAGDATLLLDGFEPTPELLLFGSQQDMTPLVELGSRVGFRVTVHAQRGSVGAASFPRADAVRTGHPTAVADGVHDEYTYAVVMSHNFVDDRLAVETLLRDTAVPYIGVMGPRERFERLRDALSREGTSVTGSELDRIAAPVGLDLGGGEPVEIALSIISEVVAVHNGRTGGRLRSESGPIHQTEDRA